MQLQAVDGKRAEGALVIVAVLGVGADAEPRTRIPGRRGTHKRGGEIFPHSGESPRIER
jgi:hypothetical protein